MAQTINKSLYSDWNAQRKGLSLAACPLCNRLGHHRPQWRGHLMNSTRGIQVQEGYKSPQDDFVSSCNIRSAELNKCLGRALNRVPILLFMNHRLFGPIYWVLNNCIFDQLEGIPIFWVVTSMDTSRGICHPHSSCNAIPSSEFSSPHIPTKNNPTWQPYTINHFAVLKAQESAINQTGWVRMTTLTLTEQVNITVLNLSQTWLKHKSSKGLLRNWTPN